MTRPPIDQARWQPWIDHVCAAVGVDPAAVDVAAIHDLTGSIATTYARPMAPVSAHLLGLALASGMPAADAREALLAAAKAAAS